MSQIGTQICDSPTDIFPWMGALSKMLQTAAIVAFHTLSKLLLDCCYSGGSRLGGVSGFQNDFAQCAQGGVEPVRITGAAIQS